MDYKNSSIIACAGYARLPEGMTAKEVYGVLGIGLMVDFLTGEIVAAESTLVRKSGNDFICSMLIGHNILKHGIDEPVSLIERRYFGTGKRAIIAAIKDAYKSFEEYKSMYYPQDIASTTVIKPATQKQSP
ncbi:DUF3870 domain-containing protein [Brevibacillus sp. NRS-1366]|uniref:DUF3870 domain-containing protein n=1 Tax=Brevibacillus sp. NRS-1366 TaxID=3233899 RepID=UPI003D195C8D